MSLLCSKRWRDVLIAPTVSRYDRAGIPFAALPRERGLIDPIIIYYLKQLRYNGKQSIVKFNNIPTASPVFGQCFLRELRRGKITPNLLVEQCPVRIAKTVNTLLNVSHYQVGASISEAFFEQRPEVTPLHGTCVLKFIDHVMFDTCSCLFVNKRNITTVDNFAQQLGRIGNQHAIFFFAPLPDLLFDIV